MFRLFFSHLQTQYGTRVQVYKNAPLIGSNYVYKIIHKRNGIPMRWAGHVARMGQGRGVHRVLVGKPEGKRELGRSRSRWEGNIKMDLQKLEVVVRTGWSWHRIGTGGGHL